MFLLVSDPREAQSWECERLKHPPPGSLWVLGAKGLDSCPGHED